MSKATSFIVRYSPYNRFEKRHGLPYNHLTVIIVVDVNSIMGQLLFDGAEPDDCASGLGRHAVLNGKLGASLSVGCRRSTLSCVAGMPKLGRQA